MYKKEKERKLINIEFYKAKLYKLICRENKNIYKHPEVVPC